MPKCLIGFPIKLVTFLEFDNYGMSFGIALFSLKLSLSVSRFDCRPYTWHFPNVMVPDIKEINR